jgi:hypothetical protein
MTPTGSIFGTTAEYPRVDEPDQFQAHVLGALECDHEGAFLTTDGRRRDAQATQIDDDIGADRGR